MLLNKHKNAVLVGITSLGVALTIGMTVIGGNLDFFGDGTITSNRFSSYGMVNAKAVSNPATNGLKSENITIEFEKPGDGKRTSVKENGFASLGYALKDANEKEPSIFNVHAISESGSKSNLEFLFESLSPTDYESNVFYQAHTPFTRLANYPGLENVKYLSTIDNDGSRHVVVEASASNANITGSDADELWRQMLIVLSPIPENTSYDLTLNLSEGLTMHGTLSTEAEQKQMMDAVGNNVLEDVFSARRYPGVVSAALYMQGNAVKDNTLALTINKPKAVSDYVKNLTDFSSNKENKFPRDFTTTITVEGETTPVHVFSPER